MLPRIIGINTLFIIPHDVGGTENHLRATLASLEKQDKTNRYVVFCNNENYDTFHFTNPLWKRVRCPIWAAFRPVRIVFEQLILPFLVIREKCSTLHSFGYFGPLICPVRHIITVHDCNWRDYPLDFGFFERYALKVLIELNIRYCWAIMSVSEFTRKRLIHYFPFLRKKICVIPSGVSDAFLKEAKKRHTHPLEQKQYILSVGALYPHKKILYLLDVWKEMIKQNKHLHLVIIGKNGKDEEKVRETVKQLPRVDYFPNTSLPKLVSFYQHARACIFPSVYEGFGYPVYEAVSVGKTVFVGKKQLYLGAIQENVYELSFDVRKDKIMILSRLQYEDKKKNITFHFDSYNVAIKKLITLYN